MLHLGTETELCFKSGLAPSRWRFFMIKLSLHCFSKGKRENQTLETRKHEKRDATAAPLLWGGICGIPHASFRG